MQYDHTQNAPLYLILVGIGIAMFVSGYQRLGELFSEYGEQDFRAPGLRRHVTVEKAHGREERREYYAVTVPKDLRSKWKGVQSVGMI